MNDWMVKGFNQFKLDVLNLSFRDLIYSKKILAKDNYDTRVKEMPFITGMLSANTTTGTEATDKLNLPKPYLIKEVAGKRLHAPGGSNNYKVGFIGLTQPGMDDKTGFVVEDPLQKIKQVLPEVRAKVDLVVVLGYMPIEMAKQLAEENQGVDVIIVANDMAQPPVGQREGNTVIVYATQQTKALGELRLYLDEKGKVTDYFNRQVALDSIIPDQPTAAEVVKNSKTEIDQTRAKVEEARKSATGPPGLVKNGDTLIQVNGAMPAPPEPKTKDIINQHNNHNH
jgi:2',3'-cyclic-nucleotide 2'-phosphodiesterase (5'-nucleotidase family)